MSPLSAFFVGAGVGAALVLALQLWEDAIARRILHDHVLALIVAGYRSTYSKGGRPW